MLSQEKIDAMRVEFEKKAAAAPKFTEVQRGPELMRVLRAPRRPIPDPTSASSVALASFLTQHKVTYLCIRGTPTHRGWWGSGATQRK